MDRNKGHKEFEHFIKENADVHRLYPSEGVWTRIHHRLHNRRRRIVAFLLLLPLLTATGWFLLQEPADSNYNKVITSKKKVVSPSLTAAEAVLDKTSTSPSAGVSVIASTTTQNKAASLIEANPIPAPNENLIAALSTSIANRSVLNDTISSGSGGSILQDVQFAAPTITPVQTAPTILVQVVKEDLQEKNYSLTIESVVNSYQRQVDRPGFRWQLHFTPTVSYRTLQEDQKFIAQARMSSSAPAAAFAGNPTDLSSVVRHRPDFGMQIGITGNFPISKKIDWVSGIQFNVSKYDIEAYRYPSEVATIALQNPWGGTSTVNTITSFRSNGFRTSANWLRNYYYSVSVPLGLQWRIIGKKHTHWGISATLQPTYVVGNRSYVISADYQNYAEVPYLINKWNLNAGFETYARFPLGKHDFRIGPQIRYQALSSFKKGYPVQEHLYDFGIKLGMILGK